MLKPCLVCGQLSEGSKCPTHAVDRRPRRWVKPKGWDALRAEVYRTWGPWCHVCGNLAGTVDHLVPMSKGGESTLENLRPACRSCNSRKGNKCAP